MAEVVAKKFGEKKISYCGLEGPSFGSYFTFAKQTLIDSRKSLIPERNKKNYNLMRRITQMNSVNSLLNGSSLWSINLVNSTLKEALDKSDQEFDFIYIDRLGHLCSSYIDELALAYDHLIDNGLIAATVRVDPLAENRFQRTLETNLSQDEFLCGWSNDRGYKLSKLSYVGGDKITIPMKVYLFNT